MNSDELVIEVWGFSTGEAQEAIKTTAASKYRFNMPQR
tara:strand:+ start:1538 stop:1651 length:114 start_codon:yes stop_codon:yes gene_type:complete